MDAPDPARALLGGTPDGDPIPLSRRTTLRPAADRPTIGATRVVRIEIRSDAASVSSRAPAATPLAKLLTALDAGDHDAWCCSDPPGSAANLELARAWIEERDPLVQFEILLRCHPETLGTVVERALSRVDPTDTDDRSTRAVLAALRSFSSFVATKRPARSADPSLVRHLRGALELAPELHAALHRELASAVLPPWRVMVGSFRRPMAPLDPAGRRASALHGEPPSAATRRPADGAR